MANLSTLITSALSSPIGATGPIGLTGPSGTINSLLPPNAVEVWIPGIGMTLDQINNLSLWRGILNNYTFELTPAPVALPTYNASTKEVTLGAGAALRTSTDIPLSAEPWTIVIRLFIQNHVNFARIASFTQGGGGFSFYVGTSISSINFNSGGSFASWTDAGPSTSIRTVIVELQQGSSGANYYSNSSTALATANQNAGTYSFGGRFLLHADQALTESGNIIKVGTVALYNRLLTTQEKNDILTFCSNPAVPLPYWGSFVGNIENDPQIANFIENRVSTITGPVYPDVDIPADGDVTGVLEDAFAGSNRYIELAPWTTKRTDTLLHPTYGHFDGRGATLQPIRQLTANEALLDVNFPNYDSLVPMQSGNEMIWKDLHLSGLVGPSAYGRHSTNITNTEQLTSGFRWTGGQTSSTHANCEARNLTAAFFQVGFDYRAWQFNRAYNNYAANCKIGHLIRNNPRGGGGNDTTYDIPKIDTCEIGMMFLNESASGFSDLLGGGVLPLLNNDICGALFHAPSHSAIQMVSYEETLAINQARLFGGKISEYQIGNSGWDDSRANDALSFTIGQTTNQVPSGAYSGAIRASKTISLYSAVYGVQSGSLQVNSVSCDDGKASRVYWLGTAGSRVDVHNSGGGGNASQPLVHSTDATGKAFINFYGSCGYLGFVEAVNRRPDTLDVKRIDPATYFFVQMFGRRGRRQVDSSLAGATPTSGHSKLGRGIAVNRVTPTIVAETLQGTSAVTSILASASGYAAASNAAWGHDASVIQFRTMQTCGTYGNRSRARINLATWANGNRCVAMIGVRNPNATAIKVMIEFGTGYTSLHFAGNNIERPFYYTLQPGIIYDLVAFAGQNNQNRHIVISPWTNDNSANQNFDIEVSEPDYFEGEQELLDQLFHLGIRSSITGSVGP